MALRSAFQRHAALCPAEASHHAAGPRRVAVSAPAPAAARTSSRRRQYGEVSLPAARRRDAIRLSAIISAPGGGLEEALGPDGKRPTEKQLRANLDAIVAPVQQDMDVMETNVKALVGERHPMLLAAAEQIFSAGGKKLRPMLCFLVARATAVSMGLPDINWQHRRLSEITEMIHTASLVHDDVLDECSLRRGKSTVNSVFGTRVAVLAGDYLFAQSSWYLANLDNLEVIKLISQVIADFANGEISQASSLFDCDITIDKYKEKSFFKTASLIAASCKSAAVFSGVSEELKNDMYEYGKHLGLAFQVVDDILDFTQSTEQLGKPQGQDLATGNLTAPIIYALQEEPALRDLIESRFESPGSLDRALSMIAMNGGLDAARKLAQEEGDLARAALKRLPISDARRSLEAMVDYVLDRLY